MKTIKLSILAIIITASQGAFAYEQTDWKCMMDCQTAGHMHGYCKKICSF